MAVPAQQHQGARVEAACDVLLPRLAAHDLTNRRISLQSWVREWLVARQAASGLLTRPGLVPIDHVHACTYWYRPITGGIQPEPSHARASARSRPPHPQHAPTIKGAFVSFIYVRAGMLMCWLAPPTATSGRSAGRARMCSSACRAAGRRMQQGGAGCPPGSLVT